MKEEKAMNDKKKCDKYESFFIFRNEEAFYNHLENCPDCREEHEKYLKVSALVKEVAPAYLKRQEEKKKISAVKKLACCFVLFVSLTCFFGYRVYDENSFQVNMAEDSYIGTLGLPTDDYGFFEI